MMYEHGSGRFIYKGKYEYSVHQLGPKSWRWMVRDLGVVTGKATTVRQAHRHAMEFIDDMGTFSKTMFSIGCVGGNKKHRNKQRNK